MSTSRPALRRMAGKRKLEEALEESEQKTQEEKKEEKEDEIEWRRPGEEDSGEDMGVDEGSLEPKSTGAAWRRKKRRRDGVAAGWTNPYEKDLADAEKQWRQQQRRVAEDSNSMLNLENMYERKLMQLKVEDLFEHKELWEQQQRGEQLDMEKAMKKSRADFEHKYGKKS